MSNDDDPGFSPAAFEDRINLHRAYARTFHTPEGRLVLAHLRHITQERSFGPEATDAQLRHTEGQRQLVCAIRRMIRDGQSGL